MFFLLTHIEVSLQGKTILELYTVIQVIVRRTLLRILLRIDAGTLHRITCNMYSVLWEVKLAHFPALAPKSTHVYLQTATGSREQYYGDHKRRQ